MEKANEGKMYIFDVKNKSCLHDIILENLKSLGVRCRLPKKLKESDKENIYSEHQIFQKPLRLLKKCVADRLSGATLLVPEFLFEACNVIEKEIKVEGIFRKAGSTCKQKERKLELNQGKKLSCECHVFDACSLVKLFFRELPQPLIPYSYHDLLLKGLLLSTYEKELDALMLTCLLLPEEHIATLAFFMEFLLKVSWHSEKNKMTLRNLAIILTPTLMPLHKETRASNNIEMNHHFKVIEMLIENAHRIGVVPDQIIMSIVSINDKKSKKKRRSGSITRMFTGLKKIVSSRSSIVSELDDSTISIPENSSTLGKRKSNDGSNLLNLSAKKKCVTASTTPTLLTPIKCRMQHCASSLHSSNSSGIKRSCSKNSLEQHDNSGNKDSSERGRPVTRTSRLNLVGLYQSRKQKSKAKLESAVSTESLFNIEENVIETNKACGIHWKRRNSPIKVLEIMEGDSIWEEETREKIIDLSDPEMITVPRCEYEEIKNRVSALEEDLELLTSMHPVQYAYEKTLEESEKLAEDSSDQLVKKLKKELNLRLSSEKVVRSPSARKIGSFRRRSREIPQRNPEPKTNLKRGRPNTLLTGLPSPRHRASRNEDPAPKAAPITRSASFLASKEDWESGETFFAREHLLRKLSPVPPGRPSLAEIRCHNAGMVLEKAKLFNSLNAGKESMAKRVTRRQSIRLENLKRLNEAEKKILTRTRSLGSDKKPRQCAILSEDGINSKSRKESWGREGTIIAQETQQTPKSQRGINKTPTTCGRRETPSIKKSLVTRSPRHFAKTPASQMRSTLRMRATPMKALPEMEGTPRMGSRRSPRFLAKTLNASSRLKD